MKLLRRTLLIMVLLTIVSAAVGETIRCAVCGRLVPAEYWVYDGKPCCSTRCVDALRPRCSECGKMITGGGITSDGKIYCSETCFERTLPKCDLCKKPVRNGFTITSHVYCEQCGKNTPRCFSCGLPAAHPTRLADGREICAQCARWAVNDPVMARKQYERALRQLEAWTSLKLETVPELELVDRTTMRKLSKDIRKTDSPVSVRGLYSRQVTKTTELVLGLFKKKETVEVDEKIYLVDHLHDAVFRAAAMHELMHDMIQEHFPKFKDAPQWVEEGICQQAAAEYCSLRHYTDILYGIENCTDPDYGNGYRYIKQQVGVGGWPALKRWMDTVDVTRLPEEAPQ